MKIAIVLLDLLLCYSITAQEIKFSPLERRYELHEEQIRYVTQLPDRRLVVFTESTINLFNGGGFKTIDVDEKNVLPLDQYTPYQYKGYLTEGKLWVKNQNRLIVINITTEKNQDDPLKYLKSLGFPDAPVNFFIDTDGDIWLLTKKGELHRYDCRKKIVSVFLEKVTKGGANNDQLFDLARINGQVYLFYKSGWMRCLNETTRKEIYRTNFHKESDADFRSRLWVNVVGPYLYLVRNGLNKGQLVRFDTRNRSSTVLLETKDYWLNNLTADKSGNFWISAKVGMWYFPTGTNSGKYYPQLSLTDGRKEDNEAYTLLYDQQGGLWVGTFNKGLYYYHPARSRFLNIDKNYFEQEADSDLRVYSILSFAGKLWVGALDGLYTAEWKSGMPEGKFKKVMPGSEVRALYRSKSGVIWVGLSEGLYALDNRGIISRHVNTPVNYISETEDGHLWICTPNQGLYLYEPASRKCTLLFSAAVLGGVKQVILWNRYWVVVSTKGLFFIDKLNHSLHSSADNYKMKDNSYPRIKDYFICTFSDDEGLLWLGSFGSLYVWDPWNKKLYQLGARDGLLNRNIKGLIQGKDKTLWVTTSRGISNIQKVVTDTGYHFSIQNYNRYDGVMDHTFSERAVYADTLQELFFGGVDGLNMLNGNVLLKTYETLSPILFDFKLFGKPIYEGIANDGKNILELSVASSDRIVLGYNQNFISIDFAGLNYINPSNTYFKYRLKGVDDDWRVERSASGTGEATYTRLAPGEYIFQLFASADGNNWSEIPKSLLIVIKPPFWLTIYAKLIYAILLIAAGWYLIRNFKRRSEQKRQKQHKEAVENAKAAFITNISHELRTPLTLIITPLKSLIARVRDTELKSDLQRIGKNADLLLDNINQLLEFRRIDETAEVLQLKYVTDLSFLKELLEIYTPLAKEKNVYFDAKVQEVDKEMWIDNSKVIRLVTNLLSNAFKFTPVGGRVIAEVGLNEEEELLIIKIKDTGVGISTEDQARIFDRFYQSENQIAGNIGSGIGLFMAKQYAEMHGGTIVVSGNRTEGSLFEVKISVGAQKADSMDNDLNDGQKKSILVIEDHLGLREFVKNELSNSYNVITANNGLVGLEIALKQYPDLIITDLMMPVMGGDELVKRIKSDIAVSHIPIIMLTARTSDQARFEGYESGADAYLVKPFDMGLLRLRIRKLLQMTEARHRSFGTENEIKVDAATTNNLDKELMERALQCVNKNLDNPDYSVEKFSFDMLMDRTGLYRKLMALTGQSPTHFIRTIRLNRAAKMLLEKRLPVSEIALEVGFNSVSYFSKCFHEKFGKTPSQYGE